ncbi:hypothetical protein OAL68_04000 [Candidatus Pelagibacter sp.]|nr:hypothetical protein [Candidatus Pelagibacter sp.]|tara:strand:+ start:832 stop:1698 length:867 start_codon:yes stop_codon:yes gene_type:complete
MKNLVKINTVTIIIISTFISLIFTFAVDRITPTRYVNNMAFKYNTMDKYRDFVTENFPVTSYDSPTTFIVSLDKKLRVDLKINDKTNYCINLKKIRGILPFQFSLRDNRILVEIISESKENINVCSKLINQSVILYNKYIIERYRENYLLNLDYKASTTYQDYSRKLEKELEPKIEKLLNSLENKIDEESFDDMDVDEKLEILENYISVKQLVNDNFRIFERKKSLKIEFLDDLVFIGLENEKFEIMPRPNNIKIFISIFFSVTLLIYILKFYIRNIKILKKNIKKIF